MQVSKILTLMIWVKGAAKFLYSATSVKVSLKVPPLTWVKIVTFTAASCINIFIFLSSLIFFKGLPKSSFSNELPFWNFFSNEHLKICEPFLVCFQIKKSRDGFTNMFPEKAMGKRRLTFFSFILIIIRSVFRIQPKIYDGRFCEKLWSVGAKKLHHRCSSRF